LIESGRCLVGENQLIEKDHTNVLAAFEMLLEEIETEIDLINNAGARAFLAGNYERVDAARVQAAKITDMRRQVADLRRNWQSATASFNPEHNDNESDESVGAVRRDFGRLRRGVRTPEESFYLPILQILMQKGGSGTVRDILLLVEAKMRTILKEADYEALPSNPGASRWSNTAQWARSNMVNEGLLKDNSPRGIWEISDKGRTYLSQAGGR
jgi:restriction system protein